MPSPIRIAIADDDADDRFIIKEAFEESRLANPLDFLTDGVDLLDYLKREKDHAHLRGSPFPGLILLDLNMPRMDGRTALEKIRESEAWRRIPICVLTTSKSEEDILRTYGLGVNSFITKPVTFEHLVMTVKTLAAYWFQVVALPPECQRAASFVR